MTADAAREALLEENREMLTRLAARHDLSKRTEIEIHARFEDHASALAARSFVKSAFEIPKGIIVVVTTRKFEDGETIDLEIEIEAVPNAELITTYELMIREAAEKFGGTDPGWLIGPT
jgi:hypothetical protein